MNCYREVDIQFGSVWNEIATHTIRKKIPGGTRKTVVDVIDTLGGQTPECNIEEACTNDITKSINNALNAIKKIEKK